MKHVVFTNALTTYYKAIVHIPWQPATNAIQVLMSDQTLHNVNHYRDSFSVALMKHTLEWRELVVKL